MTITFITETGEFVARIDRLRDDDGGGGYAYSVVSINGNFVRGGESGLADSFDAAERAVRRLLTGRLYDE